MNLIDYKYLDKKVFNRLLHDYEDDYYIDLVNKCKRDLEWKKFLISYSDDFVIKKIINNLDINDYDIFFDKDFYDYLIKNKLFNKVSNYLVKLPSCINLDDFNTSMKFYNLCNDDKLIIYNNYKDNSREDIYKFITCFDFSFVSNHINDISDFNEFFNYLYSNNIYYFGTKVIYDNINILDKIDNYLLFKILLKVDFNKINGDIGKYINRIIDPYYYRLVMLKYSRFFVSSDISDDRKIIIDENMDYFNKFSMFKFYKDIYDDLVKDRNNIFKYEYSFNSKIYAQLTSIVLNNNYNLKLKDYFIRLSNLDLTKYIFDYLFEDFYYNVRVNIKELLKYKDILPKEFVGFYNEMYDFDNLSVSDKILLFNSFKEYNFKELFYDHLRTAKDFVYKDLTDKNIKINKDSKYYDKVYSDKYGVDVYKIDNGEFYALVRCLRYEVNNDYNKDKILEMNMDGYCFSLINDKNCFTYRDPNTFITLLYELGDYKNIVHMYHSDSFSKYNFNDFSEGSNCVNEIYTANDLLNNTDFYNEIVIKTNDSLKACGYVCFGFIRNKDVVMAKKLDLPIVLICEYNNIRRRNSVNFDIMNLDEYIYDEKTMNNKR